jgi:hypothetical protein
VGPRVFHNDPMVSSESPLDLSRNGAQGRTAFFEEFPVRNETGIGLAAVLW